MDVLHRHELDLIFALQSLRSPLMDALFIGFNIFDHASIYFIIVIIVYHLINEDAGFRLLYLLFIKATLCDAFKAFFAQPRPYELVQSLKVLGTSGYYGLPSGAATSIIVTLGFIFFLRKPTKATLKAAAIIIIGIVGLTRVYLGAHFPSDVLGGYILGISIVVLYAYSADFVSKKLHSSSVWHQLLMHAIIIFCCMLLHVSFHSLVFLAVLLGALVWHLFFQSTSYSMAHSPWGSKCLSALLALLGAVLLLVIISNVLLYGVAVRLGLFFLMGFWLGASTQLIPSRMCRLYKRNIPDR